jgi:hypothetical protein
MGAETKKAGSVNCLPKIRRVGSDVRLGLAQTRDAVAGFPLAAFLEDRDALEALQDVAFHDETGDALETFVL